LIGWRLAAGLNRPVLFTNHDYARRIGMYQRAAAHPNLYTVFLTPNMARHYALAEQPPKISVISACCGDRFFDEPLVRRSPTATTEGTLRLAGAGSLLRWKKWDLLVEALRRLSVPELKRIEVSIWGPIVQTDPDSPKYEAELRRQIRESGLEDRVLLRGTTGAMGEALRQADWFILPSTNEPCSVALMEALALGLPALVSASGGNVDIVRNGETGCFFEPGNAADLADKLRPILNSQAMTAAPEKIRESVRERSASAVGRRYCDLYRRLFSR
jgi:glycosyltransferase involved in cell wall biosynthesis